MNGPEPGAVPGGAPPRRPISPSTTAVLLLLLVFAVGVLAGITADRQMLRRHAEEQRAETGRVPSWALRPEEEHRRYWNDIQDRLGMSPEQRAQVDSLIRRRARHLEAVRNEMEPAMLAIIASTRGQIDSLLTPEQRIKLEEIRRERRARPRQ